MGAHTTIQSLLSAQLALVSPGLPICRENVEFTPPKLTDAVLPQITLCSFLARTPAVDDVYTITVDTVSHTASGATLPAILTSLAAGILGAVAVASPPGVRIQGTSDATPFTVTTSAKTAGGADIAGALGSPAVVNTQDPYVGNAWLRSFLMEGRPMAASVGTNGLNRHAGVFQVDVHYPAGKGWGACRAMADTLCALFRRGTVLTSGSSRLFVDSAGPEAATQDGQWYRIPVSIYYTAYVEND